MNQSTIDLSQVFQFLSINSKPLRKAVTQLAEAKYANPSETVYGFSGTRGEAKAAYRALNN